MVSNVRVLDGRQRFLARPDEDAKVQESRPQHRLDCDAWGSQHARTPPPAVSVLSTGGGMNVLQQCLLQKKKAGPSRTCMCSLLVNYQSDLPRDASSLS